MTYMQPLLPVVLLILITGLVCVRRFGESRVLTFGITALLLLSWPPVEWLFSRPLEAWYQPEVVRRGSAEAIVVLSSSISPPYRGRPYALPDKETYERCRFAAWLYSRWQGVPVLACGGPGSEGEKPYAAVMREVLKQAGVPENMIWTEDRSHSTHENAVYGAQVLRRQGVRAIALVVEAQSMLRAEACFRKQGLTVLPAPSDFRELGPLRDELIPSFRAICRNEVSLHEVLGLAWYRLHGWI